MPYVQIISVAQARISSCSSSVNAKASNWEAEISAADGACGAHGPAGAIHRASRPKERATTLTTPVAANLTQAELTPYPPSCS
jgi:hypothetical protein